MPKKTRNRVRYSTRRHRRPHGFNWYSVESYFTRLRDTATVKQLRLAMKAMVDDDTLWDLIEVGVELEGKRQKFADAANKRIEKLRIK
jgi:hypothetical protein